MLSMLEKGSEGKSSQSLKKESSSVYVKVDGKLERWNSEILCFVSIGKSKSNQGWTPLHLAAYFGHKNVVQVLLEVSHLDYIKAVL